MTACCSVLQLVGQCCSVFGRLFGKTSAFFLQVCVLITACWSSIGRKCAISADVFCKNSVMHFARRNERNNCLELPPQAALPRMFSRTHYFIYTYVCIHTYTYNKPTRTHIYIYIYTYVFRTIHIYIPTSISISVYLHVHININSYSYISLDDASGRLVQTLMYTHTLKSIYTHLHLSLSHMHIGIRIAVCCWVS